MTAKEPGTDDNPYQSPTTEKIRATSSRAPSYLAWFGVIVGSLAAGGFAFFVTCVGVVMLTFSVGASSKITTAESVLLWVATTMPFLAFILTVGYFIFAGRKTISRIRGQRNED